MRALGAESSFDPEELAALAIGYGQPEVLKVDLTADKYLFQSRRRRADRRRGEVVMVVEQTPGYVLIHRKGWYERGVYRLPTGGIEFGDTVEGTLIRELKEETGLRDGEVKFLGIITCQLQYQTDQFDFTSYIFHILHPVGQLQVPDSKEDISDIREIPMEELAEVANNLRQIPDPRNRWGHWRAIAHDFTFEALVSSKPD